MDPNVALLMRQISASTAFETHVKSLIQASEDTIVGIDSQMRDLARLRDRERGIIATLRSAIVPVKKLSAELLVEIFLILAMPVPPLAMGYNLLQFSAASMQAVLAVSQVSAYWRNIALTTPRLWTYFFSLYVKTKPTEGYLTVLKLWLDRSSPLPIPVCIESSIEPGHLAPLMKVLIGGANRWRELTLAGNALASLPADIPHQLEQLRSVVFVDYELDGRLMDALVQRKAIFLGASNLRKGQIFSRGSILASLPWMQLCDLTLNTPLRACLEVLKHCANLVHFHHRPYFTPDGLEILPGNVRVVLPQLITLGISTTIVDTDMHDILGHIICPLLKSLHVSVELGWTPSSLPQFQQSSPCITEISLQDVQLTSAELIGMLRNSPLLEHLRLHRCYHCVDDTLLNALNYRDSDPSPLAPALTLVFFDKIGDTFSQPILETAIRSRWWSNEDLASIPSGRHPRVKRWRIFSVTIAGRPFDQNFKAKFKDISPKGLFVLLG